MPSQKNVGAIGSGKITSFALYKYVCLSVFLSLPCYFYSYLSVSLAVRIYLV